MNMMVQLKYLVDVLDHLVRVSLFIVFFYTDMAGEKDIG